MKATNIDKTTASNIDQTRAQEQGQGKPERRAPGGGPAPRPHLEATGLPDGREL